MQKLGFIHDMMDVKVLILFVMARSSYPLTLQQIYELCYQDDCLSYFDVCAAVPELVESGHLCASDGDCYEITEKGREHGALTADSIAFTVKQRAENAVAHFNRMVRRGSFVKTLIKEESDAFSVEMSLDDDLGCLMKLTLQAPDQRQANRLGKLFEKKAEAVYSLVLAELLDEEDGLDA